METRNVLSGRFAQVQAAAIVMGLCFATGIVLALMSGRTPRLGKNEFRLEITNDSEGGMVLLTANASGDRGIPVHVYCDSSQLGGSLTGKPAMATLTIQPRGINARTLTEMTLSSENQERAHRGLGMEQEKTRIHNSASTTLGDKPFRWAVESGVYPKGKPLLLGTADNQNVTLVVGDTAQ